MDSLAGKGDVSPQYTNISFLEHVVVRMTLALTFSNIPSFGYDMYYSDDYELEDVLSHEFARRGDISVSLRSPQGTISQLLPYRERDFINTNSYRNWEFMSVHYWGENPLGTWELLVSYKSKVGAVRVSDVSVNIYGTRTTPLSVVQSSQCTNKCNYRCSFSNAVEICDSCLNKRDSESLKCLAECPANYNEISGYCMNPNSSGSIDKANSNLALIPTTTEIDKTVSSVSPTPSSAQQHSHNKFTIVSTAPTHSKHQSILYGSSVTVLISYSPVIAENKEFKNSRSAAGTQIPHILQWLLLIPLLWMLYY